MKTLVALAGLALTFSAAQSPGTGIDTSRIFTALEIQRGQTVGEVGACGDLSVRPMVAPARAPWC